MNTFLSRKYKKSVKRIGKVRMNPSVPLPTPKDIHKQYNSWKSQQQQRQSLIVKDDHSDGSRKEL